MRLALATLQGTQRVGDNDFGEHSIAPTLHKRSIGILTRNGVSIALQRGGGATEHHTRIHKAREDNSGIAGIVAWRGVTLLIARVVLLINHDQPKIFQRQEECRAHTDNQLATRRCGKAQIGLASAILRKA